eukprot:scaffold12347_cov83-Phaeocystis_antarctica.AAC.1
MRRGAARERRSEEEGLGSRSEVVLGNRHVRLVGRGQHHVRLVARHTACGDGSIAQVDDLRPFPCAGGGVVHVCEPQEGQRPQRCSGAQRVPPAIGVDVLLAAILELQPGRRKPSSWSGLGQTVSVQLGKLEKPALAVMRKSIWP